MSTDRRRNPDWPPLRYVIRARLPDWLHEATRAEARAEGVNEGEIVRRSLAARFTKTNAGSDSPPAFNVSPQQAERVRAS